MEINLKKLSDQKATSTSKERKMKLSEDAQSMVFQLFTKNVYSNPIGTVVREITSNCFDSHVEAKVDSPVLIKKFIDKQTDTQYISFIDYGVGMSPDRIYNIYGTYFESTKRVDNTQIGGFGIGGKTPLAYKRSTGQGEGEYDNSFYVITIFDNIKYYYCIYEGEETPVISELHNEPTTERNGTEVRIPVLEKDIRTFEREMVKQLYYFENIIFDGFEDSYEDALTNDYQIIRGKSFMFRGGEYSGNMHICLGRVAYPIDFDVLGLNSSDYRLPIAVRLEVGDIGVTVSRESLDYSETTIKKLKKIVEVAKKEIVDLISKQYKDIKTLKQYFEVKNDFGKLVFKNGASLYVGNLIEQKDVDFSNFTYSFMKMPNDKKLFKFFFEGKMYGKKPSRSRYSSNNTNFDGGYDEIITRNNLMYFENEFQRKVVKQAYLKQEYETYYIIGKRDVTANWMRSEIADLFNVHLDSTTDDNGLPVATVQSLLEMQEEYMQIIRDNAQDYDSLEIPEDFVASRKRNAGISVEMRKLTIPVKFVGSYNRGRVKLDTLFNYNMPIFYGTSEQEHELKNAKELYKTLFNGAVISNVNWDGSLQIGYRDDDKKGSIMFIQLAQNNVKYMQHCKKAYPVSMFNSKMLHRKEAMVRKYFQTNELVEKFDALDDFYTNKEGLLSKISPKWHKQMEVLHEYVDTIPEESRNRNLHYLKDNLIAIYKLDNIKPTGEQILIMKKIEKFEKLHETNSKILGYINLPYRAEHADDQLIDILKKVMVFKS